MKFLRTLLRILFGPSREEVWRTVAAEIGADFIEAGRWGGSRVQLHERDWIITLETFPAYDRTWAGLRAPFVNRDGFAFMISSDHWSRDHAFLKSRFGMVDLEVGHPRLDKEFKVTGNSPEGVRGLFSDPEIRRLVRLWRPIHLGVYPSGPNGESFPSGVSELRLNMQGVPKDPLRIKDRFELFVEILNHLDLRRCDSQGETDRLIATLTAPGEKIERRGLLYWDGDPPRHRAAEELTRFKDVRAVPGFISILNDPDAELRGKSVFALGELGDKRAVPALISILNDQDTRLREKSIIALGKLGDERAVPALIPLLGDRNRLAGEAPASRYAANALRGLNREDIVAAFRAGLSGELDLLKRVAREHRIPVIHALLNYLERARLSSVRAVASGLVDLGATEALPALRKKARWLGRAAAVRAGLPSAIANLESRASLPRPASTADLRTDTLPRSASEPGPDTATLPRAVDDQDQAG